MIKNLTLIVLLLISTATIALSQIRTPAASPSAKFVQTVGLTEVTIEYSRPGVKDREIFGGLVPFGEIWRTGANSATKISFDKDVTVEGQALEAGSYAILTKPGATNWDVHFYKYESGNFGSYLEKTPDAAVNVVVQTLPFSVENFFITIANLKMDGGVLEFIWDNALVPVQLGVHTDKQVMADIERKLAGPTVGDYYTMGQYMHSAGKDLEKALKYVRKATSGDSPQFWQVRQEALILADLGRKAEAIKAAKKSMELARAADNNDYIRMNEKSIKEWSM